MRRKLTLIVVAVVGLVVGVGIGAAGKSKTVTHTRTVTVAQTRTITTRVTQPGKTVTRTVEHVRRVVPAACQDAIAIARRAATAAGKAMAVEATWPTIASQAAEAGLAQDSSRIIALANQMKRSTAVLNAETITIAGLAVRFNADATRCR